MGSSRARCARFAANCGQPLSEARVLLWIAELGEVYWPLVHDLRERDPFLVCADFRAYIDCQRAVAAAWRSPAKWLESSILNTARAGKFSSDRAIREYAANIWNVG